MTRHWLCSDVYMGVGLCVGATLMYFGMNFVPYVNVDVNLQMSEGHIYMNSNPRACLNKCFMSRFCTNIHVYFDNRLCIFRVVVDMICTRIRVQKEWACRGRLNETPCWDSEQYFICPWFVVASCSDLVVVLLFQVAPSYIYQQHQVQRCFPFLLFAFLVLEKTHGANWTPCSFV